MHALHTGWLAQAEQARVARQGGGIELIELQSDLVEGGIARLGQGFTQVEDSLWLPVVERHTGQAVPVQATVEPVGRASDTFFHARGHGDDLEDRSGWIRGFGRTEDERAIRSVECLPLGVGQSNHESIRVEAGIARQSEDVIRRPRWIHHDSAAQLVTEGLKGGLLEGAVQRQVDIGAGHSSLLGDRAHEPTGLVDDLDRAALLARELLFGPGLHAAAADPVGLVVAGGRQLSELIGGGVADIPNSVGCRLAKRIDAGRPVLEGHAWNAAEFGFEVGPFGLRSHDDRHEPCGLAALIALFDRLGRDA